MRMRSGWPATLRGLRGFIRMLPKAGNAWTPGEAAHLLNRAGFGGTPSEVAALHALGREPAVDSLLAAADASPELARPAWAAPEQAEADRRKLLEERRELQQRMRELPEEEAAKLRTRFRNKAQGEERRRVQEARAWWFRRILASRAPLQEKMTLFWHDHFATSVQKVKDPVWMLRQNELFRKHALGGFKELTQAVVRDPAMMIYLDANNSRKDKPNENFARELFELFTLGEGNYSEEDIREAARAFTGYRINRLDGSVSHIRRQWDEGSKTLFGKTGKFTGSDVVALAVDQPGSSRFIARKIWEFFAYEDPPAQAVSVLGDILRANDHCIAPLLREMFLSREFYSERSIGTQIKSPVQFLAQLLRQLEVADPPAGFPGIAQQQLGQALFAPPNVAGWDWGKAWINTNTLLTRYNLAGFISKGSDGSGAEMAVGDGARGAGMARRAGQTWKGPDYAKVAPRTLRQDPDALVTSLAQRFFDGRIPDKARATFAEYARAKKGAVFTDKETAELCHLMLSTPYYQLC